MGAISSFLAILDKIHEHLPAILGWIETISAATKFAGHRHRERTGPPSEELKGSDIGTFNEYAHIIKSERLSSVYKEIPLKFRGELDASINELNDAAKSYFTEYSRHNSAIYESGRKLLDLMAEVEKSSPSFIKHLFADLEDLYGVWEKLTLKEVRMYSSVWRFSVLAEYINTLMEISNENYDCHSKLLLDMASNETKQNISKECEVIILHSKSIENLGGEYPKYDCA